MRKYHRGDGNGRTPQDGSFVLFFILFFPFTPLKLSLNYVRNAFFLSLLSACTFFSLLGFLFVLLFKVTPFNPS